MFNAYPDSLGGNLSRLAAFLTDQRMQGAVGLCYVLPSMFRSDLDRGFSVIAYELDEQLASPEDLQLLRDHGIELKLDFVLNHLSAQSPQFLDLLQRGDESPYVDFFLDWNRFWAGEGEPDSRGFIVPHERHLAKLFMRKPGLPVLELPFPDGTSRFYWNTFYQEVIEDPARGQPRILGQMDLNARSPQVWDFYARTMERFAGLGARIVRLDAFAYLHKEVGRRNFFNEPGTWDYLERIRAMAEPEGIELLPEIHAAHHEGVHRQLAERGYRFYDFFFPVLAIHAIETGSAEWLETWINEIIAGGYRTVNMLGCHDGIPVLDVQGLLEPAEIDRMIELIVARGGRLKDLYGPDGRRIAYYQVNATYFSALGEREDRLLFARALQIFMPGIPQVWYLDLLAGVNDHAAADAGGHKEINRSNLSEDELNRRMDLPLVRRQLELLRWRNDHPAFAPAAELSIARTSRDTGDLLEMVWTNGRHRARLVADFATLEFSVS